jgi:hypothetical protein
MAKRNSSDTHLLIRGLQFGSDDSRQTLRQQNKSTVDQCVQELTYSSYYMKMADGPFCTKFQCNTFHF